MVFRSEQKPRSADLGSVRRAGTDPNSFFKNDPNGECMDSKDVLIAKFIEERKQLRSSLRRCLSEAVGWIDEACGGKPEHIMGYDGWARKARQLLKIKKYW